MIITKKALKDLLPAKCFQKKHTHIRKLCVSLHAANEIVNAYCDNEFKNDGKLIEV